MSFPSNVIENIRIHAVIPKGHHEPYDLHTHGLEKFGHKELQVFAPGYCVKAMMEELNRHADRILNHGERYAGGESCLNEAVNIVFGYVEVPGDSEGDPSRLRIVDLPGGCECERCHPQPKG